mgnify:CR=1 FL=1
MTNLYLGQMVTNFGFTATVIGFHEITGDPILQDIHDGSKWDRGSSQMRTGRGDHAQA